MLVSDPGADAVLFAEGWLHEIAITDAKKKQGAAIVIFFCINLRFGS
jgi:hypothetical protein